MAVKAYLEVTMQIPAENRKAAAKVYSDYRKPFLETIPGAESKALLVMKTFRYYTALIQ